jgi:hypothetical protein
MRICLLLAIAKADSGASTPAMMACLVDMLWTIENLCDDVMKQQAEKRPAARIEELLKIPR